jgi:hypothetical protein
MLPTAPGSSAGVIPMIRGRLSYTVIAHRGPIAETRLNSFRTYYQERGYLLPILNVGGCDEDLYLAYPVIDPGLHLSTPTPT